MFFFFQVQTGRASVSFGLSILACHLCEKLNFSQMDVHYLWFPVLRRLSEEEQCAFKASQSYLVRPVSTKPKETNYTNRQKDRRTARTHHTQLKHIK